MAHSIHTSLVIRQLRRPIIKGKLSRIIVSEACVEIVTHQVILVNYSMNLLTFIIFLQLNFACLSFVYKFSKRGTSHVLMSQSRVEIPKFDPKLSFSLGKFSYSLFPFSPESSGRRKSILRTIVPDTIWTIDQIQGILNVNGE